MVLGFSVLPILAYAFVESSALLMTFKIAETSDCLFSSALFASIVRKVFLSLWCFFWVSFSSLRAVLNAVEAALISSVICVIEESGAFCFRSSLRCRWRRRCVERIVRSWRPLSARSGEKSCLVLPWKHFRSAESIYSVSSLSIDWN